MEEVKKGSSCTTDNAQKKMTQHLDDETEYKSAKEQFLSLLKRLDYWMDRAVALAEGRDVTDDSIGMRALELLQRFPPLASEDLCADDDDRSIYPLSYFVLSGK